MLRGHPHPSELTVARIDTPRVAQNRVGVSASQSWSPTTKTANFEATTTVKQHSPDDVHRDLLFLRKGPGFTPERFVRCEALRSVLGGGKEPDEVLQERFESAIDSLVDDEADLMRGVYALRPDTNGVASLGGRRDVVGRQFGIGRDAVADRDAAALENLRGQLISGWYPKSPIPIRVPESHNGIVHYAVHSRTFVRDGRFAGAEHRHSYYALFNGADHVTIDTVATEPVAVRGDVELRTVPIRGGQQHQFWLPEPMHRGRTYELQHRIAAQPAEDESLLEESGIAFHEPTRLATFEVVFTGRRPTWVWYYSGLTHLERPGKPYRQTLLTPDERGLVGVQFRDAYGGFFHGLAWEW